MADGEYDLITIGAGSGGVRASRFAASLYKAKVCCVELPFGWISSDTVGGAGGTCVIRGCVPKKLLVYGAAFRDEFKDAAGFGWTVGATTHDWATLVNNKAKEIQRLNSTYNTILKSAGVTSLEGRAIVVDARTVDVQLSAGGTKRLKAKQILVATGGYATRLEIEGKEHAITSDEALSLGSLPSGRVVVIGSGYIGCEFAGIYRGLGADTHLMLRADKPLTGFDEECRSQVAENMVAKGVTMHTKCNPTKIVKNGENDFTLHYTDGSGAALQMPAVLIMMATGRRPRSSGIGLEALGVEMNATSGAIIVDEYLRTSVPGIWAVGDVTDRINLTPVALMEGMSFAKSAFGGELTSSDYAWVPSAVFSSPPLASVGFTEEAAVEKYQGDIDVYSSKFRPMKGTLTGRDEKTLMKMLVHVPTDRVIGIHMVGPDAPEIMQGMAIALKAGATKKVFDSTVGIHPSAAEEFVTMRTKTRTVQGRGVAKL